MELFSDRLNSPSTHPVPSGYEIRLRCGRATYIMVATPALYRRTNIINLINIYRKLSDVEKLEMILRLPLEMKKARVVLPKLSAFVLDAILRQKECLCC